MNFYWFLISNFAIKDLGCLNFFLGIEVLCNAQCALLSQKHYILDLLKRNHMLDAKLVRSPMGHLNNFVYLLTVNHLMIPRLLEYCWCSPIFGYYLG
jgi:hypothetical protein